MGKLTVYVSADHSVSFAQSQFRHFLHIACLDNVEIKAQYTNYLDSR